MHISPILLAAALLSATTTFVAPAAQGSTASNLTTIDMGYGDSFWNYDFNSTAGGNTNVDWAISWLWYSNAEVNKVKNILSSALPAVGSAKYARLSDGAGALWDQDGGVKGVACPVGTSTRHVRLYADGDDRFNNPTFGYYVIGSNHTDVNECGGGTTWYGDSETVEDSIATLFRSKGYATTDDRYGWLNYEPARWEGDHYWYNNGLTSTVVIP